MITDIYLFNVNGDVLVSKQCKPNFRHNVSNIFRVQIVAAQGSKPCHESRLPVLTLGSTSFTYIRLNGLWLCAVTRSNQDCSLILEYLFSIEAMILKLIGCLELNAEIVVNNFTLIYSIFDETMEFGFPTTTDLTSISREHSTPRNPLKRIDLVFLKTKGKTSLESHVSSQMSHSKTSGAGSVQGDTISSAVPWRSMGIKHRRNEVFLNVMEKIHVLANGSGQVLRSYLEGHVYLKTRLLGMPECQFGLADPKLLHDPESKFHQCVDLALLDSQGCVKFVPPDGEFQLMLYRCVLPQSIPFHVQVRKIESSAELVVLQICVRVQLPPKIVATNLSLVMPIDSLLVASHNASQGKAKNTGQEILWKMPKFVTDQEATLDVRIERSSLASIRPRSWMRLSFDLDMYACLGIQVRYLRISEDTLYKTVKWIKYMSQAGLFEIKYSLAH